MEKLKLDENLLGTKIIVVVRMNPFSKVDPLMKKFQPLKTTI